jgi:hypothetical protein
MKEAGVQFSLDGDDRLFRGHGQSMYDIMHVRQRKIERIPDVVIWAGKCVLRGEKCKGSASRNLNFSWTKIIAVFNLDILLYSRMAGIHKYTRQNYCCDVTCGSR